MLRRLSMYVIVRLRRTSEILTLELQVRMDVTVSQEHVQIGKIMRTMCTIVMFAKLHQTVAMLV